MFRKLLFAVLAVACIAPIAHAQTVDEILDRHWEATGGKDKWKTINSMRMTGKMTVGPGMEAPLVIERKRPGLMRTDFTFQGMTGTQAFDGKQGWSVMPFMGKKDPEAMSEEDTKEMTENVDFDGPFMNYKDKGHTVELVGKESVEGAETFKLKLTRKNGNVEYHYFDVETYLPIKTESKRKIRGTEAEVESIVGDYKDVDGLMVAHSMSQGAKGSPQKQAMTFEKFEFNVDLPDARFAMPAAAPAAADAKAGAAKAAEAKKDAKAVPAKKGK